MRRVRLGGHLYDGSSQNGGAQKSTADKRIRRLRRGTQIRKHLRKSASSAEEIISGRARGVAGTARAKRYVSAENLELSLILPAYNEARRLPPYLAAVRSHLDACYGPRYEVLVVDDGSRDGLTRYPPV